MLQHILARAAVVGLGRVGVVRRAYRSSMKTPKMHLKTPKKKKKKTYEINCSYISEPRWKTDMPTFGPRYFASPRFVRILICLQIFRRQAEKLSFVVKGKCTTVILQTLLTLYIVHMLKFFIYFVHKPFCFAGNLFFIYEKRGVFLLFCSFLFYI